LTFLSGNSVLPEASYASSKSQILCSLNGQSKMCAMPGKYETEETET